MSRPFGVGRSLLKAGGELFQDHERGVLVGMPAPAEIIAQAVRTEQPGVRIFPEGRIKTECAVTKFLESRAMAGLGIRVRVARTVPFPDACGNGVSTGEMTAAVDAVAKLIGGSVDAVELGRLLASIEPTDSTFTDGRLRLWNFFMGEPRSAAFRLPEGSWVFGYPRSRRLTTDHVVRPKYTAREREALRSAYGRLPGILARRSRLHLANVSILSARINACYHEKPELPAIARLHRSGLVDGYWTAHSGVAVGVMGPPERLAAMEAGFRDSVGPDFGIWSFVYDVTMDDQPFAEACGRTLRQVQ